MHYVPDRVYTAATLHVEGNRILVDIPFGVEVKPSRTERYGFSGIENRAAFVGVPSFKIVVGPAGYGLRFVGSRVGVYIQVKGTVRFGRRIGIERARTAVGVECHFRALRQGDVYRPAAVIRASVRPLARFVVPQVGFVGRLRAFRHVEREIACLMPDKCGDGRGRCRIQIHIFQIICKGKGAFALVRRGSVDSRKACRQVNRLHRWGYVSERRA